MYPGEHFMTRSDQPALIMSGTGETMSYAAYKARTNRLAHLLRAKGLNRERSLRDFHGKQCTLCRDRRRRRTRWPPLYLRELVPYCRRTREGERLRRGSAASGSGRGEERHGD
jgi:hypothetical protein